jgi:uncharacterized protein YbaR (Trm112 family)
MDKRLLDILCCPVSKSPVKPLSRAQLDALNGAIQRGAVQTTTGAAIAAPLQAGLITADGKVIYRIEDDIPVMLADEAIGTTQLDAFPA